MTFFRTPTQYRPVWTVRYVLADNGGSFETDFRTRKRADESASRAVASGRATWAAVIRYRSRTSSEIVRTHGTA